MGAVSPEMSAFLQSPKHEEFIALFVRYEPAIHSFLTSLLANLDDAEVVMQETSMAMWKKFGQFEAGTSFRNWGFQIARFEAMNFRRRKQRDRHFFSDELVQLLADDAAQHAAQLEEERRVLAHCLAKLDSRDHGLLSGCYREGSTIKEYAESVGRTPNAVRKHLARIRTALSLCVQRTLGLDRA
ncbi:MAG: sigma-70 family RNA polymerase sigma factor [Planctomycetota bacterium]|nr:sigma-70 family RNA polymerase sigma factor [Planctomycetota bacterium]